MSRRFRQVAREGFLHVVRHPLRSGLSALTCAVAIAVTVNVISLSYGLDEDIRRDVRRFGRNTIDVGRVPILLPGMSREPLGSAQVQRIHRALVGIPHSVAPRKQAWASARGDVEVARMPVMAVPPEYPRTLDLSLRAGRWFADADPPGAVCVLDESAAQALFPGLGAAAAVGRRVAVTDAEGRREREVLGVLEDPITYRELFDAFDQGRGSRTLSSGLLSFRNLYVPESELPGDEYAGISVAIHLEEDIGEAAIRLGLIWPVMLSDVTGGAPSSVGIFVRRDWMDALGATTATGAFLGNLVWIIVVGVAGIMISTLNLITIRERYDEIAVRRCEGARRRDVAFQVTVEGTLIALAGGLVGLPMGSVGAEILKEIVRFPFRFEGRYAVVATAIAIVLGLISAVLPARRAARLDPAAILSRRVL